MKLPRSFFRTLPDAVLLIVALLAALVAVQANDDAASARIAQHSTERPAP